MKKIIIFIILLAGAKITSAQEYMQLKTYQDTANYLIHEVEMKKKLYINKPLSVLLDSLKVKPIFTIVSYAKPNHADYNKVIYLDFNVTGDFNKQHYIIVDFVTAPKETQLKNGYNDRFTVDGQQEILNLYKPLLVKDVYVKNYQDEDPIRPGITDNSKL